MQSHGLHLHCTPSTGGWLADTALWDLQRSGTITYNGKTFDQFVPERTSAYVTQYDEHMAELTVRETLDFSRRVQGAGNRPGEASAPTPSACVDSVAASAWVCSSLLCRPHQSAQGQHNRQCRCTVPAISPEDTATSPSSCRACACS